jgi:hypothetical protein
MMGLMLLEMFIRLLTSLSCWWRLSSIADAGGTMADTALLSSLKMENPSFDFASFHEGDFTGDLRPFLIRTACAPRGCLEADFWVLSVVMGAAALFLSVITVDRGFTAMFGWLFSLLLLFLLVCFKW